VLLLALYGVRSGQVWAWVAAVAAPVLALAIALPAHYPWHLDTLGHLGLLYLATLVFGSARCCPVRACSTPDGRPGRSSGT
jgi:hypothetical protein